MKLVMCKLTSFCVDEKMVFMHRSMSHKCGLGRGRRDKDEMKGETREKENEDSLQESGASNCPTSAGWIVKLGTFFFSWRIFLSFVQEQPRLQS